MRLGLLASFNVKTSCGGRTESRSEFIRADDRSLDSLTYTAAKFVYLRFGMDRDIAWMRLTSVSPAWIDAFDGAFLIFGDFFRKEKRGGGLSRLSFEI